MKTQTQTQTETEAIFYHPPATHIQPPTHCVYARPFTLNPGFTTHQSSHTQSSGLTKTGIDYFSWLIIFNSYYSLQWGITCGTQPVGIPWWRHTASSERGSTVRSAAAPSTGWTSWTCIWSWSIRHESSTSVSTVVPASTRRWCWCRTRTGARNNNNNNNNNNDNSKNNHSKE